MICDFFTTAGLPPLAINGSDALPPLAVTWTPIAKDGRDLPPWLQRAAVATRALTSSETRDLRFTPERAGTLTVGVHDRANSGGLVASQQIDLSAP